MVQNKAGYWSRLLAALLGREPAPILPELTAPDERLAEANARAAALEMDLRERDERIATMRAEYEALRVRAERAAGEAGQDHLERLFRALAGPLSNLAALVALADAGKDVQAADLADLVRGVEKELLRAGLEPIGKVGELTSFEAASHQRMSGGAVRGGTPVIVRLPGYRMGQKVLLKAMVSAQEGADGQGGS